MNRFKNNEDGTVTDNKTGLTWSRNANHGRMSWGHGRMSWGEAMEYCEACHEDWRLPTIEELLSLLDYSQYDPVLPEGHPFENVQSAYYWSSSTSADDTDSAWVVYMYGGDVFNSSKSCNFYVWPVRGGRKG